MDHSFYEKIAPIHNSFQKKPRSTSFDDIYSMQEVQSLNPKEKIIHDIEIEKKILDCKEVMLKTFKGFLTRFLKDAACFSHMPERLRDLKERIQSLREKIIAMMESIEGSKGRIETLMNLSSSC